MAKIFTPKTSFYFVIAMAFMMLLLNITTIQAQKATDEIPLDTPQAVAQVPKQTATPMPQINSYTNKTTFTLQNLGVDPIILRFPSSTEFDMDLPNHWSIIGGEQVVNLDLPNQATTQVDYSNSYIDIHYDLYDDTESDQYFMQFETDYPYVGILRPNVEIYVDDFMAGSFRPKPGIDQWKRFPIPSEAVRFPADNPLSQHTIRIDYYSNNDFYCYYTGVVKIYDDSAITLAFRKFEPDLSLADFPRPLVQEAFLPETLYVVIPDNYNDTDLAATANIASSIGLLGNGNITIETITASQATSELLANANAIFIGTPEKNSAISSFYKQSLLPTKLNSDGTISRYRADKSVASIMENNGVLQLMRSNYNSENTFLIITGHNDEAVLRAAKSLSSPPLAATGSLIIVEEFWDTKPTVTPTSTTTPTPTYVPTATPVGTPAYDTVSTYTEPVLTYNPEDTFAISTFQVTDRTFTGIGAYNNTFNFYVPRNWSVLDGAMIKLNYSNSTNLRVSNSSISLFLNNLSAGSAPLSSEKGEKSVLIPLNKQDFNPGTMNSIRFEINNATQLECANVIPRAYWTTIRADSILKIPHDSLDAEELTAINQVYTHPTFYLVFDKNILLSLPSQPTSSEINSMVKFAYSLGTRNEPDLNFQVSTNPDEDLSDFRYKDYNVVLMGRPSRNPQIARLDESLPQPFVPGEDTLIQRNDEVAFQIPQDVSIGIVQVIGAPWNFLHGVTVLTGTTDEAYQWAIDNITNEDAVFDFFGGDISFIAVDQIEVLQSTLFKGQALDTVINQIAPTMTTLEPIPTKTSADDAEISDIERYIVPTESPLKADTVKVVNFLVIGLAIAAVIFIVFIGIKTARGGRRN